MPLIVVLGRQRQVGLCEFEVGLVYISKFQDSQDCIERPCLKNKPKRSKK